MNLWFWFPILIFQLKKILSNSFLKLTLIYSFFHRESNTSGTLMFKYFRVWFRFFGDIHMSPTIILWSKRKEFSNFQKIKFKTHNQSIYSIWIVQPILGSNLMLPSKSHPYPNSLPNNSPHPPKIPPHDETRVAHAPTSQTSDVYKHTGFRVCAVDGRNESRPARSLLSVCVVPLS